MMNFPKHKTVIEPLDSRNSLLEGSWVDTGMDDKSACNETSAETTYLSYIEL